MGDDHICIIREAGGFTTEAAAMSALRGREF
jgi:type IV secretion system protein VirB9